MESVGGSRERSRGSIGVSMQSYVKTANPFEDTDRSGVAPFLASWTILFQSVSRAVAQEEYCVCRDWKMPLERPNHRNDNEWIGEEGVRRWQVTSCHCHGRNSPEGHAPIGQMHQWQTESNGHRVPALSCVDCHSLLGTDELCYSVVGFWGWKYCPK
jgi:hypothetical protein